MDDEILTDVSFFTSSDNVDYILRIYDGFEDGELIQELSNMSGKFDHMGFHTVKLDTSVRLKKDDNFYIYLDLSDGYFPIDKSGFVWGYNIESISHPGESYYYDDGTWKDLYEQFDSANFCIKGLVSKTSILDCDDQINWNDIKSGENLIYNITIRNIGDPFTELNWEITDHPDWGNWEFSSESGSNLTPEDGFEVVQISVTAPDGANRRFTGEIRISNNDYSCDYEIISVTLSTPKNKSINILNPWLTKLIERFPILELLL
jgi:hypothetical protein